MYDQDGYDQDGYDRRGYDRQGYDRYGINANRYDRNGRCVAKTLDPVVETTAYRWYHWWEWSIG